jgi:hypothetical protein
MGLTRVSSQDWSAQLPYEFGDPNLWLAAQVRV